MTQIAKEIQEKIDRGGELDTRIKKDTRELDGIKKDLRAGWSDGDWADDVIQGSRYQVKASDYTSSKVLKDRVIMAFLGISRADLQPGESIPLDAGALRDLLDAADFKVSVLKKTFTEEGMDKLLEKKVKRFNTLKFSPIE